MSRESLYEFCDKNDVQITSMYKALISVAKIDLGEPHEMGEILVEKEILEEALKTLSTTLEPFFCDYLEEGHRIRMMLQPQRVWFGTLPGTQEQQWLLTALDIQTDEEIILRLSHINA